MTIRRTIAAVAVLVGVGALTACSGATEPPGPRAAPQPPPAALVGFYGQQLEWRPCGTDLDCTTMTVPLDYAAPEGRTAQIAVNRRKATDPARRMGSLVINPGGPGGSGTDFVAKTAPAIGGELGSRFDIVGFDPRGVGASTPSVRCFTDAERDAHRATEPDLAAMAASCAARNDAVVLANIGTRDVARDLDVLRATLGDEQLTFLGFSYGTSIGTVYAEQFPGNVRALVLDGAIDPSRSRADSLTAQGSTFSRVADEFAVECVEAPACPLGTDAAGAATELENLLAPLEDKPAPTTTGGRTLSGIDAGTALKAAMYNRDEWPDLRAALTDLRAGDGTGMLVLADAYEGRAADGTYDNGKDLFLAVDCVDYPRPAADSPEAESDVCAHWSVPNTSAPHEPQVDGIPQVLVVSTTGDPATPYREGVTLAKQLGARLLTVEGEQHTATLSGSACVDDVATRYLVELAVPAKGATCELGEPVS
ncbi:alpha/beta hydrolase [Pseudonocardia sp. TRM90224]|uniref:alpha/beta hydrolase n=1 Tax=Pseudonocardia sp. TRM90224 TaxID=2812678 RepID=UPI001E49C7C3|nr:alpha/beta hydrolase [Pseudonocardia sp. TRM90224]